MPMVSNGPFNNRVCFGMVAILALASALAPVAAQDTPSAAPAKVNPDEMIQTALDCIENNEFEKAAQLVREVGLLKPNLPRLFLARGLLYGASGRQIEAMGELGNYIKTDEGQRDHRGYAGLGQIFMQSRMYREAIDPLEKAARLAPTEEKGKNLQAQITMLLATAYANLERTQKAVETATKAQAMAPRDPDIQLQLSQIAASGNEYKVALDASVAAISIYQARISDDAFNEDAHQKLRKAFGVLSSLIEYNRKLEPKNGEHDLQYARLIRDVANLDRRINLLGARNVVRQALTKNPDHADMLALQAQLEVELGASADARATLESAIQKHPENQELKRMLADMGPRASATASP